MDGQLDALELLEPPTLPSLPPVPPPPLTCPGCGQTSPNTYLAGLNHWIHKADSQHFGRPVCIRMNLHRNHVLYWCKVLSGDYTPPDKKCCHGAIKSHTGKTTREFYLQHLRLDIHNVFRSWKTSGEWLPQMLEAHGLSVSGIEVWRGPTFADVEEILKEGGRIEDP